MKRKPIQIKFTTKKTIEEVQQWNIDNEKAILLGRRPKLIWLNKKQLEILVADTETVVAEMGRGAGKSKLIHFSMAQRFTLMPKGAFFLAGPEIESIKSFTLSGLEESWADLGWEEGVDYVKFKPPPPHFARPYSSPLSYEHVISHRDGGYYRLMANKGRQKKRGASFDGGDMDEALSCSHDFYENILLPTLRGNLQHFDGVPTYRTIRIYTSQPKPDHWLRTKVLKDYEKDIAQYGVGKAITWISGNIYDNFQAWGQAGIDRLKASMTHLAWLIEVMNVRISKSENPFYAAFSPQKHTRQFERGNVVNLRNGKIIFGEKELDRKRPIVVSFDFGGWFMGCAVAQESGKKIKFFKEFFDDDTDSEYKLTNVCNQLTDWIIEQGHVGPVIITGDRNGTNKLSDGPPLFKRILAHFAAQKIPATLSERTKKQNSAHSDRHSTLNQILGGSHASQKTVEINTYGCEYMIAVLQSTDIKSDFQKNKSSERDTNLQQRYATHFGDVFDYGTEQFVHSNTFFWDFGSAAGVL